MKIEVMTGKKFDKIVEGLNIDAKCIYHIPKGDTYPHYEIWTIDKSNLEEVESACALNKILFCYSKGTNRGTAFEPLTIKGQFMIGWTAVNGEDTFDNLMDYLKDGLEISNPHEICACAITMAKNNGMTFIDIWKKLM